ncbi:MAG: MFS transporter [Peptococcaceae bacterium]|nr:MFS transporter [Peptococcaceae bacterium]
MIAIMTGLLFAALNQTIIGTAMPRIIAKLGGMEYYSWIFTMYMLTSSIAVSLVGKLSDIYGRKLFLLAGLTVFMAGSLLSGLANTIFDLIVYRGVQGLGGGMIMSTALASVGDLFTPRERGRWQGLLGAVFALASIIGPVTGGYIVDHFEWHWVFWVNLPVGIVAFGLIATLFPQVKGEKEPVDFAGAFFLTATLIPLLLALSWAGIDYPWTSPTIAGLFTAAGVALVLFIWTESRAASPIVPLHLFRNSIFTITNIIGFLTFIGMFGTTMFIPLFVQGIIGVSATYSGLVLIPLMLSNVTANAISGQITSRTGKYKIMVITGAAILSAGIYLLSCMDINTTNAEAVRNMIITGIGLGITMPLTILIVQNAVPYRLLGVATSTAQLFRSLGGTVGVAVMGTVLVGRMNVEMAKNMPATAKQFASSHHLALLHNPQALLDPGTINRIRASLPPEMMGAFREVMAALKQSLAVSLEQVWLCALVAVGIALVLSFFVKEIPLQDTASTPSRQDATKRQFPA